jgi:hypothetical protein
VATITTLRAALVSNLLIHSHRVEPSRWTRKTAARASSSSNLVASKRAFPPHREYRNELGFSLDYVFGSTMMFAAPGRLCGDPGAWLTPVGVTVNTYSLPGLKLIA